MKNAKKPEKKFDYKTPIKSMDEVPKDYSGKLIMLRKNGTRRVFSVNRQPSKTDQQWAKEADMNSIIAQYQKTGQMPPMAKIQGQFADVSQIEDLLPSLMKVELAKNSFMKLPAHVRSRFGNKTENMISFLQDPSNNAEAIKLGLRKDPNPKQKTKTYPPDPKIETNPQAQPKTKAQPTNDDKTTKTATP